jgi:predicted lipid-binding transport protein (Tim44 family)
VLNLSNWSEVTMKLWTVILALALLLVGAHAEAAKRLGGGKSIGQQSTNVSKREAATPPAPTNSTAPATQAAPAKPATPPAANPAPAPAPKPWGAMLGGLAAGLGLAWLAHSLGFGAEFGQFLMFGLLALVLMMAVGWFMRRKQSAAEPAQLRTPYAFETAGNTPAAPAPAPKQYNPANVGNDASARPWERQTTAFDVQTPPTNQGSMIGSALQSPLEGSQSWGVPAGFDAQGFVEAAKRNFVTLQAAWDKSDIATLRSMMTDEMLSEIQNQLSEREKIQVGAASSPTEVVMLNAQLLGIEELPTAYMASVEFSGVIREDAASGPAPFREVWNMTKAKDGSSGWLVAGLQALQ